MNANKVEYLKSKGLSDEQIDEIMKIDAKTGKAKIACCVLAVITSGFLLANYVAEKKHKKFMKDYEERMEKYK